MVWYVRWRFILICGAVGQSFPIYFEKPLDSFLVLDVPPATVQTCQAQSMFGPWGYGPSEISVVCTGTYVHSGDVITIGQALPTLRGQETGCVWGSSWRALSGETMVLWNVESSWNITRNIINPEKKRLNQKGASICFHVSGFNSNKFGWTVHW